jgi:hypothetical protein
LHHFKLFHADLSNELNIELNIELTTRFRKSELRGLTFFSDSSRVLAGLPGRGCG